MTDPLRFVNQGETWSPSVAAHNAFVEAARAHRMRDRDAGRNPLAGWRDAGIVPIKNASATDLERGDVLGIDGPLHGPDSETGTFWSAPVLVGSEPDIDVHEGAFAVLLEPLDAGAIGRCCVSGICPAYVDVVDPDDGYADVVDGQHTLRSEDAGSAQILWANGTGVVPALVRISNLFEAVPVTSSGSSASDSQSLSIDPSVPSGSLSGSGSDQSGSGGSGGSGSGGSGSGSGSGGSGSGSGGSGSGSGSGGSGSGGSGSGGSGSGSGSGGSGSGGSGSGGSSGSGSGSGSGSSGSAGSSGSSGSGSGACDQQFQNVPLKSDAETVEYVLALTTDGCLRRVPVGECVLGSGSSGS
jgi:hypothetical protein